MRLTGGFSHLFVRGPAVHGVNAVVVGIDHDGRTPAEVDVFFPPKGFYTKNIKGTVTNEMFSNSPSQGLLKIATQNFIFLLDGKLVTDGPLMVSE